MNRGTCIQNGQGFSCNCLPGYTGNMCEVPTVCYANTCQNGASCTIASDGTAYCQCPANFYGRYCEKQVTLQLCSSGDSNPQFCLTWSNLGFCSFKYTYELIPVPVYCPSSCGLCTAVPACADTQTNCALWYTLDLCSKINSLDPNLCRRSCGLCPQGVYRYLVKKS